MGEWKGSPRKQIIQKLVELFKEDPTFGLKTLVRRKAGPSGIDSPPFQSVESIDELGGYLSWVNQRKKMMGEQLKRLQNQGELLKKYPEFLPRKHITDKSKEINKDITDFKLELADDQQKKIRAKELAKKVTENLGGSGEVRRQRRNLDKTVRILQQKRPFDN